MYPPHLTNKGQIQVVDINTEDLANQNMYGNYITCPRLRVEEKVCSNIEKCLYVVRGDNYQFYFRSTNKLLNSLLTTTR